MKGGHGKGRTHSTRERVGDGCVTEGTPWNGTEGTVRDVKGDML